MAAQGPSMAPQSSCIPPGIPGSSTGEGQGETEAQFTQQPQGTPSPIPSVREAGGSTGAPPARSHNAVRRERPQSQRGGGAPPAATQSLNWSHWVPPPPGWFWRGTAPGAGPAWACTIPWGQGGAGGAPPHPNPRGPPRQRAPRGTHTGAVRERARAAIRGGDGDGSGSAAQQGCGETEARRGGGAERSAAGSPPPAAPSCRRGGVVITGAVMDDPVRGKLNQEQTR